MDNVTPFKGRAQSDHIDPIKAEQEVFIAVDQATMLSSLLRQMHNESREASVVINDSLDRINVRLDSLRTVAPQRFHKVLIEVDLKLTAASLKLPENSAEEVHMANCHNKK